MEPTGKYGHCALTDRWVLRAQMRGATVKVRPQVTQPGGGPSPEGSR